MNIVANNNNICKKRKRKENEKNVLNKTKEFSLVEIFDFFSYCLFFMENNGNDIEQKCHTIDVIEKMLLRKKEMERLFESMKDLINQSHVILNLCKYVANSKDYIIEEFNKEKMIFKKHDKMINIIGKKITEKLENEEEIDAKEIDFFCKQVIRLVWFFREGKNDSLIEKLKNVNKLIKRINKLMNSIYIIIKDERKNDYEPLITKKFRQINNIYDEEKKIILTSSPIISISYYRDYDITNDIFGDSVNIEKNKKYAQMKNLILKISDILKIYNSNNNMEIMKKFNMKKFKHSIANLEILYKEFNEDNKIINKIKKYRDIFLDSIDIDKELIEMVKRVDFIDYYYKRNIKESIIYVDKNLCCHQDIVNGSYNLQMFYKIKRFCDEDLICLEDFIKYSDEYIKNNSSFLDYHHIEGINEKYIKNNNEKNIEMYLIVKNPSKSRILFLLNYVKTMKKINSIFNSNNVKKKDYIIPYDIEFVCKAPKIFLLKMTVNFSLVCSNKFDFLARIVNDYDDYCECTNYSDKAMIEMLHQHEIVERELSKNGYLSMFVIEEAYSMPFVRMDPNGNTKIEIDIYPMCYLPVFFKEINPSIKVVTIDEKINFDKIRHKFYEMYKYNTLDSFEIEGYRMIKNVIKENSKILKNGDVNTIINEKIYTTKFYSKSKIMINAISNNISYPNLITIDDSSRQRTFYDMRYTKLNNYHHYIHFQQQEYNPQNVINFQKINNNISIGKINMFFSQNDIELQLLHDINIVSNALPEYSQILFMAKYYDVINSGHVYLHIPRHNEYKRVNAHIDLQLLLDNNGILNTKKIIKMIMDIHDKSMELLGYNILLYLYQDFFDNVSYSRKDDCYSIDFATNLLIQRENSNNKRLIDIMEHYNIDFNHCALLVLCSLLGECKKEFIEFANLDNNILNINNNTLSYSGIYCFSFLGHLNIQKMKNKKSNTNLSCSEFKQMMNKVIYKYDFLNQEYSLWNIIQKFSNIYRIFFSSTFRKITTKLDRCYTIEGDENISLINYFNAISSSGNILKRNESKKISNDFLLDLYQYNLIDLVEKKIRKSEGYGLDSTIISNLFNKVLNKIISKRDDNNYIILFKNFYMTKNECWRIMLLFILQIKERLINIRHLNFPIHPIYIIYIYAKSDIIDVSYLDNFHEIFAYIQLLRCNSPFHSSSIGSNFIQELFFSPGMTFKEKMLQYDDMIEDYILTNIKMISNIRNQCDKFYNCIFNPDEDPEFKFSLNIALHDFLHILMKQIPITIFYKTFFVPFIEFKRKDIMKSLVFQFNSEYKYETNVNGTQRRKIINMKRITLKWLKSLDDDSFKKLVFNITGSTFLGPNDKIHFHFDQELNFNSLPQYQVCINSIFMPEYMLLFDKDDGFDHVIENTIFVMNKKVLLSFEYDNFDIV